MNLLIKILITSGLVLLIANFMPVYLMGIGTPVEILKGIALGVDIFDSRMPTQNG